MSLTTQLPAPQNSDSLPAGAPRGREAERLLYAQLLAEFRDYMLRSTEAIGRLVGNIVNDTLEVGSAIFDSNALIVRSFHAPIGHVVVDNQSATNVVWVRSGAGSIGGTPGAGPGLYPVPAGQIRRVAIADHNVTFYGTATDRIAWHAFTTPASWSGLGI